jgi:hypothetical protein
MSPQQEAEVVRLAEIHGRVHVSTGYRDGWIRATVPGGGCWRVYENGRAVEEAPDHSVDWAQQA